ncbi:MAG: Hsp20/alpha crystallin family protein [Gaiellaceae bacterium]
MSWLKRLMGSTDAVADARERAAHDSEPAPESSGDQSSALPGGWGKPDVSDEGDVIVIALQAPGLEADTVSVEPHGSSLQVRAEGERGPREHIKLDESLKFPEGSDLSGATASYSDDKLVVRIPKAGIKQQAS